MSLGWQRRPRRRELGKLRVGDWSYAAPAAGGSRVPVNMSGAGAAAMQDYLNTGTWSELEERTAAYNDARKLALSRLRLAARECGALAVVDVRVRQGRFGHAQHAIEFTTLGTAVTSDRVESDEEDPIPLVSLGGTDFWKLVDAGVWPLGLVGGASVVFILSGSRTRGARLRLSRRSLSTQEFADFTNGLRHARLHAFARMRREATELGASGVLSVSVRLTPHEQRADNLMVTVEMLGTAVAPLEHAAPPTIAYALGLGKS